MDEKQGRLGELDEAKMAELAGGIEQRFGRLIARHGLEEQMAELGAKLGPLEPDLEAFFREFAGELDKKPAGRRLRQVDQVEVLEALLAALDRLLDPEGGEPAGAPAVKGPRQPQGGAAVAQAAAIPPRTGVGELFKAVLAVGGICFLVDILFRKS